MNILPGNATAAGTIRLPLLSRSFAVVPATLEGISHHNDGCLDTVIARFFSEGKIGWRKKMNAAFGFLAGALHDTGKRRPTER